MSMSHKLRILLSLMIVLAAPAIGRAQATGSSSGLEAGSQVEVSYGGVWLPGRLTRIEGGTYQVSFRDERSYPADLTEGFSAHMVRRPGSQATIHQEMTEAASRPPLKSPPAAGASPRASTPGVVSVGEAVEVSYGGAWIPAVVKERRSNGTYLAAFRDERSHPSDLEETFTPAQIRRAGAELSLTKEVGASAAKAGAAPGRAPGQQFAVGTEVVAACWGSDERAVVRGFSDGEYVLDFKGKEHCGTTRKPDKVRAASAAPGTGGGPAPASLPQGQYTCFASVPRYAGSRYVAGVGSVPNYSFTYQRQGTMSFGNGTWSGGPGGSGRFQYSDGQIRWSGGSLDGKTSSARMNSSGKLEVTVPVTGQGNVDRWHCSPGKG